MFSSQIRTTLIPFAAYSLIFPHLFVHEDNNSLSLNHLDSIVQKQIIKQARELRSMLAWGPLQIPRQRWHPPHHLRPRRSSSCLEFCRVQTYSVSPNLPSHWRDGVEAMKKWTLSLPRREHGSSPTLTPVHEEVLHRLPFILNWKV